MIPAGNRSFGVYLNRCIFFSKGKNICTNSCWETWENI